MAEPAIDDTARARSALYALDANCDRDSWVRVLMAAKAAALSFEDVDAWSATADNYGGEAQTLSCWRSVRTNGAVTA
jgi:putative DNA primase/helicase